MSDETTKTGEENEDTTTHEKSGEEKVFTDGQQKQIDDLIGKAFGKGMTKAEAASREAIAELNAKIVELKADKGDKDDKKQHADLSALKEAVESLKQERDQAKIQASSATLKAIASELDAVSSDQVAMLVAPFIKQDGNKTSVINAEGEVRYNKDAKEMTVRELIKEFLTENSHLVKAAKGKGSGSESAKGKSGSASDMAALKKMSPTERITQARKQGIK